MHVYIVYTQNAFHDYSEDEPINLQEEEGALTLQPHVFLLYQLDEGISFLNITIMQTGETRGASLSCSPFAG